MAETRSARCPRCSRYAGSDATFCPHCGASLAAAEQPPTWRADVTLHRATGSSVHRTLKVIFAIWLVAYPVVACSPVLFGASSLVVAGSLLAGILLLVPWLIGDLILGLLVVLTRS